MPNVLRIQGYTAISQRAIDPALRLFISTGNPKEPERELALAEAMVERRPDDIRGVYCWWTPPAEPSVRD